jgi:predicted NUDIX family NTP pyrophosphohydrolase
MPKLSAGLVLFRKAPHELEVFLVHPGGPFWAKKDDGAWSIPKGEYPEGSHPLEAAQREFEEETGQKPPGPYIPLGEQIQPSGKLITAWACQGDFDPSTLRSNTFSLEWPKNSGKMRDFPEVDRGAWFSIDISKTKLLKGQIAFLDRLTAHLTSRIP